MRKLRKGLEDKGQAFHWPSATLEELGKAVGVDRTYVSRILQLNSLSPSWVERILSGDEPTGLSLESLRNAMPEVWARQGWG